MTSTTRCLNWVSLISVLRLAILICRSVEVFFPNPRHNGCLKEMLKFVL